MSEGEANSEQQLEAFRESISQEIAVQVQIFPDPDIPFVSLDPMSMGIEERMYTELSADEKRIIGEAAYKELGINTEHIDQYLASEYHIAPTQEGDESIQVKMYKTNRTDVNGLYLHEIHHPDGEKQWVLASGDESWIAN